MQTERKRARSKSPSIANPISNRNKTKLQLLDANSTRGDSSIAGRLDMSYATLQGLSIPNLPPGLSSVLYDLVVIVPRSEGVDVRALAFVEGTDVTTTFTLNSTSLVQVSLAAEWATMVQMAKATYGGGNAQDSRMVYGFWLKVQADSVSSQGSIILKGNLTTGVSQALINDVFAQLPAQTTVNRNFNQTDCFKKAIIELPTLTAPSVCRSFTIRELTVNQITSIVGQPVFYCANWAYAYVSFPQATGLFQNVYKQPMIKTINVPYGVLPYFCVNDNTVQIMHLVMKFDPVSGAKLVFTPQAIESGGIIPPADFDGTWVGVLIYTNNPDVCTMNGSLLGGLCGQLRMWEPTSMPCVALNGLVGNNILCIGSFKYIVPPGLANSTGYSTAPPEVMETRDIVEIANDMFTENGTDQVIRIVDL